MHSTYNPISRVGMKSPFTLKGHSANLYTCSLKEIASRRSMTQRIPSVLWKILGGDKTKLCAHGAANVIWPVDDSS